MIRIAVAGDTMLGRGVAERLGTAAPRELFSDELRAFVAEADLFLLNLECCVSTRGEPWKEPGKPFFFRAPPVAMEALQWLGVDAVTLANNHALDFGVDALLDTFDHLEKAGIALCGAGRSETEARRPLRLVVGGISIDVIGVSDHPSGYAAGPGRPGVAFADLRAGSPKWLRDLIENSDADVVVVTPHWGPNMTASPRLHVKRAAGDLVDAGATLVAGHSAHVFHGVAGRVLYDLGDFIDDYAVDPVLRNDLGLVFIVSFEEGQPLGLEAAPIKLDYCYTRLADEAESNWILRRFKDACGELGTQIEVSEGRARAHLGQQHRA